MPGSLKIKEGRPKWLLVDAVGDLPSEIVDRPKKGFEFPFKEWISGPLKREVLDSLGSSRLSEIFDKAAVGNVWIAFERGSISWSRVWSFYVMEQWVRRNL
jgi:asparagine synthase (glutamine-hydrolysing)